MDTWTLGETVDWSLGCSQSMAKSGRKTSVFSLLLSPSILGGSLLKPFTLETLVHNPMGVRNGTLLGSLSLPSEALLQAVVLHEWNFSILFLKSKAASA